MRLPNLEPKRSALAASLDKRVLNTVIQSLHEQL